MTADELPPLDAAPAAVRTLLRTLDTEGGTRKLGFVIIGLVVLAVAVLVGRGGSRPRDPSLVDERVHPSARLPGFSEAELVVVRHGVTHRGCVAVADTESQREQGLMGRHDLAGYAGMVFRFPAPTTARFYMRATPLPLSIAWFDDRGRYVSSAEMDPCPDVADCPTYGADRAYRLALETARGGLRRLGVGSGSTLTVGGACS